RGEGDRDRVGVGERAAGAGVAQVARHDLEAVGASRGVEVGGAEEARGVEGGVEIGDGASGDDGGRAVAGDRGQAAGGPERGGAVGGGKCHLEVAGPGVDVGNGDAVAVGRVEHQ